MINDKKNLIDNLQTFKDRKLVIFHLVNKFGNHKIKKNFCKDKLDIEYHTEEYIQAGYIILKMEIG